jgi:hypothetical protein
MHREKMAEVHRVENVYSREVPSMLHDIDYYVSLPARGNMIFALDQYVMGRYNDR